MAHRDAILPALLAHKSALIDQALSEALRAADADELGGLAESVLRRDLPDRAVGLILRYHQFPAETRHMIIDRAEDLAGSIRKSATRHGERGALNALDIIESAASTRMAYLVTGLIRHASPALRDRSAACVIDLAARARTSGAGLPQLSAEATDFLTEAVEQAVVLYANHRHTAILEAMAYLLPRPMPEALAALRQPEHAAVEPLGKMLARADCQAIRGALLPLLGVPSLARSAAEGLQQCIHMGQLAEPLRLGHLLALPMIRKGAARIANAAALWPGAKERAEMTAESQRSLPALVRALPMDPQDRVLRLAGLARATHTSTRLATLRRLLVIATREQAEDARAADHANDAIAAFTNDPDVVLARIALWHLIRIQYAGLPRILAGLVNSRHPEVRTVAARRLAPLGFEKLWNAWPKLDPARRLAAGRALIKIDDGFHKQLGTRLGSRDPAIRLRAIGIITTLSQGAFFEPALLDLAGSDDPRIVASAVLSLGGCGTEPARRVIELALDHDDARIRANAIESLAQADAKSHCDKLLEMAGGDAQRPRANAIKALMEIKSKDALPILTHMLSDTRAEHRVSALWLIDELGLLQLARQVAEMSVSDDDDRVKQRAGHVVQHLIEDLERQVADPFGTEAA